MKCFLLIVKEIKYRNFSMLFRLNLILYEILIFLVMFIGNLY